MKSGMAFAELNAVAVIGIGVVIGLRRIQFDARYSSRYGVLVVVLVVVVLVDARTGQTSIVWGRGGGSDCVGRSRSSSLVGCYRAMIEMLALGEESVPMEMSSG